MTAVPPPENTGDIYRVHDYPFTGAVSYGAVFRVTDKKRPGHWCWAIEMDDGDVWEWNTGTDLDMALGAFRIELVRRNPLPERETT